MSQSFDNNNLLELANNMQYTLYINSNNNLIYKEYLINLNDIIKNYIKYGNNGDEIINLYFNLYT
jgi:hypothetical protein